MSVNAADPLQHMYARGRGVSFIRTLYLFSSAAAALLSLLSKNALPECSAGVSRAVNKVFTAQCERFSCGKKAVNFEYLSIQFRNTNWLLLERHLREMKSLLQISTHRSVVRAERVEQPSQTTSLLSPLARLAEA